VSKATETADFLARYNTWRRANQDVDMPDPRRIGTAIDDAVKMLRENDAMRDVLEEIAKQQTSEELDEDCRLEHADFEGAYNIIVGKARDVLTEKAKP
jgi:hypothetical protein